ncbi:hypothetical protein ACTXT7_017628 [Hymenolepis weldensis]
MPAKGLLNKLKYPDEQECFHQDGKVNRKNDRLSVERGVSEKEVNKHPHSTKSSTLMEEMENINKDHLIKACSRFRIRIESVKEAEGGYIE